MLKFTVLISVLSIIISLLSCKKSATVSIVGFVDSANGTLVRVTNNNFKVVYDSTYIRNNKFILHTTVPEEGFYQLDFINHYPLPIKNVTGWTHPCLIFLENKAKYKFFANGIFSILYNRYNLQSTSFNQIKLNEFNTVNSLTRDSLVFKRKLYIRLADDALFKNRSKYYDAYADTIKMMDDKIRYSYRANIQKFTKINRKTLVTPYLITQVSDLFENYSFYKGVLDNLSPEIKKSKYYDEAADLLHSVKNIYVGSKVPDISGKDLNGNPLNIDYKKSKITLIDFWASYCGPCREQVPELKQLYKAYKKEGLEIVSISIDEDAKKWKHASVIDSLPWYNICELTEQQDSKNIRNFVIKSVPSNYLVNREGNFIGKDVTLDSIKKIMEFKRLN